MKLLVVLTAVLITQQSRACAPSCAGASTSQRGVVNKTIERVMVSGVEEAQWRGICHSFCITEVAPDYTKTRTLLQSWPAVLEVHRKCKKLLNYLRCVEGCASRRFLNTSKQCEDDCSSNGCNPNCFDLDSCEIRKKCDVGCRDKGCSTGCSNSKDPTVSNDQLPAAPVSSDIVILPSSTGSFLLDVYNTQPKIDANVSSSVHSFVVRINGDDITRHWWMINLETIELDLSEFICKEVNISFAVISEHGVSDFSPSRTFCIEGANATLQPPPAVNVTFEEKTEDPTQPGLFTVNVSWTHPIDLPVMLTEVQYEVRISRPSCDKFFEITLPSNITSISEPGFDPDCRRLTVMVYTLLNGIGSRPNENVVTLQYPEETLLLNHTVGPCYAVTICASLLRQDPLLLGSITEFRFTVFVLPEGGRPDIYDSSVVKTIENMFNYCRSYNFTLQGDNKVIVSYRVDVTQKPSLMYRGPVSVQSYNNIVSLRGIPPSTINSIDIVNGTVDVMTSTILLNITWEPPDLCGELEHYDLLLIGTTNQTFGGEAFPADATSGILNSSISLEIETYLLQLYSTNEFGTSEPSILSFKLSDYYDNTTELVTNNKPVVSKDTATPTYAYYIIGIGSAVLLIVITLIILCLICVCYVRWNNAKELPPSVTGPFYSESGNYYKGTPIALVEKCSTDADAWEVSPDHIRIGKELGSGFFGEVYRCTIQGPITTPYTERNQLSRSIGLPAAVKILKENATEKMYSDFIKEIDLMKRVGQKHNSHVVSMICCTMNQEPKALVLEYVEYGDLLQYLQKNKAFILKRKMKEESVDSNKKADDQYSHLAPKSISSYDDQYSHLAPKSISGYDDQYSHLAPKSISSYDDQYSHLAPKSTSSYVDLRNVLNDKRSVIEDPYPDLKELLPVDMVTFAYQIADGMEYLSSLGIIHRDLACRNVLVGTNKVLKISDFGLARQLNDSLVYCASTEGKLPLRWMAPEAIKNRTFSVYSDIWSYGVSLWEICTLGAFPYPLLSNSDVLDTLLNGQRLEKPPNCTEDLYEMMLDCWKADPELRPSFSFLKHKTEEVIQQANQDYPYLDFNLNDYLPYCTLRLTSEAVSTENALNECKQGEDNEKESSGSEVGKEEKEAENEDNTTGV